MVDSHFHSNIMQQKGLVLDEGVFADVSAGLDIGTSPDDFGQRLRDLAPYPRFYLATGLYPGIVDEGDWSDLLARLESVCCHPRNIALGEIGLDYHWNYGTPTLQKNLFFEQIALADELDLPVLIHCREAEQDLLRYLNDHTPRAGFLIHCFSGDSAFAESIINLGGFISFAGNLTYPKNTALHRAAAEIPSGRLLTETDSPFLSPHTRRGKPNKPANVAMVNDFLAELRGVSAEKMEQEVERTFHHFFHIDEKPVDA